MDIKEMNIKEITNLYKEKVMEKNATSCVGAEWEEIFDSLDKFEEKAFDFLHSYVLKDGLELSDIWSVAYENLLREITQNECILGIYVLHHILQNIKTFSDPEKVAALDSEFFSSSIDCSDKLTTVH